jgi:hypothetical protein
MRVRDFENLIAQSRANSLCATSTFRPLKKVMSRKCVITLLSMAQSRANAGLAATKEDSTPRGPEPKGDKQ